MSDSTPTEGSNGGSNNNNKKKKQQFSRPGVTPMLVFTISNTVITVFTDTFTDVSGVRAVN